MRKETRPTQFANWSRDDDGGKMLNFGLVFSITKRKIRAIINLLWFARNKEEMIWGKESKGKAEWILTVEKQRVTEMLLSFGGKTYPSGNNSHMCTLRYNNLFRLRRANTDSMPTSDQSFCFIYLFLITFKTSFDSHPTRSTLVGSQLHKQTEAQLSCRVRCLSLQTPVAFESLPSPSYQGRAGVDAWPCPAPIPHRSTVWERDAHDKAISMFAA